MSGGGFVILAVVLIAAAGAGGTAAGGDGTTPVAPPALPGTASDSAVVTGSNFSRSTNTHHAECATPGGAKFQVVVPAATEYQLRDGQPCPAGPREPLATDKYPDLFDELTKQLPYGGGDRHTCGEWQTVDKQEAREFAAKCPPLKWGDIN